MSMLISQDFGELKIHRIPCVLRAGLGTSSHTNHQNSNTQEFLPARTTVSNRAPEHQATTRHLYHLQRCNLNWSNRMPKDLVKKLTKILSGAPVLWVSKLQTEIALSTTEAEYVALSQSMRDLLPMKSLLSELIKMIGAYNNDLRVTTKSMVLKTTMAQEFWLHLPR